MRNFDIDLRLKQKNRKNQHFFYEKKKLWIQIVELPYIYLLPRHFFLIDINQQT